MHAYSSLLIIYTFKMMVLRIKIPLDTRIRLLRSPVFIVESDPTWFTWRKNTMTSFSQGRILIFATHCNKSQKQEHLKIHILLYFPECLRIDDSCFFTYSIFFFKIRKKYLLNRFVILQIEQQYNHYASFYLVFFSTVQQSLKYCANCA